MVLTNNCDSQIKSLLTEWKNFHLVIQNKKKQQIQLLIRKFQTRVIHNLYKAMDLYIDFYKQIFLKNKFIKSEGIIFFSL